MRRPKGIKTKKSVAKRFKITATGKVLGSHAGRRHLLASKNPKRRRRLGKRTVVDKTDAYRNRKTKKRNFRALLQILFNAAARGAVLSYCRFMEGLKASKAALDRKVL